MTQRVFRTLKELRVVFCPEFIRKLCIGIINEAFPLPTLRFRVPRLKRVEKYINLLYNK